MHCPKNEPKELIMGIRPEDCKISLTDGYPMEITFIEELGSDQFVHGIVEGQKVIVRELPEIEYRIGQKVRLNINLSKISWFNKDTGERMRLNHE